MALQVPDVDEGLVEKIVDKLKSQGIFDQFRKDCLADVDSRPAYQNLRDKVNSAVANFLSNQPWQDDLNKNKVRESLRKHVQQSYLEVGVNRIVEQVVNPKIFSVFMAKVEDIVYQVMGLEKPTNTEDRSHNRLRFLLSSMPPTSASDTFAEILPSDLDPVSPGSINESGNESANLNDSITSKTVDETDNISRDVNKESCMDINENSNDSQVSGISDLSSHGSTKLDISESAHLPGDKPETIRDTCINPDQKSNSADADKSKQVVESSTGNQFDFDNFSNLKEKLMKTDPLNKTCDKERTETIAMSNAPIERKSELKDNSSQDESNTSEVKEYKDDSMSVGVTTEESKVSEKNEKNPTKSPVPFTYSEDSLGSNGSKRKFDKNNSFNESTRNSLMECDDSSVSLMEKKFDDTKEHEAVSLVGSLKDESQMSVISSGDVANLKSSEGNSRDKLEISSPDILKSICEDKGKEDDREKRRNSSRKSDERGSKHRTSRDSSRDRRYSKDSKRSNEEKDKSKRSDKERNTDPPRKDPNDKYSSRSRDDRNRSDRSRHDKKSSVDDSSKKDKDSKRSSNDDKNIKRENDSKRSPEKYFKPVKDSHYSSDDEKSNKQTKDHLKRGSDDSKSSYSKEKDSKMTSDDDRKNSKKDSRRSHDDGKVSGKEGYKSSKIKEGYKSSSSKDVRSHGDDDKNSRRDKKPAVDEHRSSRTNEREDLNSSSKETSWSDRKSSGNKEKDCWQSSDDDKSTRKEKDVRGSSEHSSDVSRVSTKDKLPKQSGDDDKTMKAKKDCDSSSDKSSRNKSQTGSDKKQESSTGKEKRKSSSEVTTNRDEKSNEKRDDKKRKRENCKDDVERKENRRSRDRDDGGHGHGGSTASKDRKDEKNRKSSSSGRGEDGKVSSTNSKKGVKEAEDDYQSTSSHSLTDIDIILMRIDSSIKEENENNEDKSDDDDLTRDTLDERLSPSNVPCENNTPQCYQQTDNGFNKCLKKPKIANNIFEIRKIMQARKSYEKKIKHKPPSTNVDEKITNKVVAIKNSAGSSVDGDIIENEATLCDDVVSEPDVKLSDYCRLSEDTCERFHGFDVTTVSSAFKSILHFDAFLRQTYVSVSKDDLSIVNDRSFSTDNNLNDIDLRNSHKFSHLIKGCQVNLQILDPDVCNNPPISSIRREEGTILTPFTKSVESFAYSCLNESACIPDDSSNVPQSLTTSSAGSAKTVAARVTRRKVYNLNENSVAIITAKNRVGENLKNEDAISLNESSSSEQCFTMATVTEDMLDNFMKKNIIDKSEECYDSSESEKEDNSVVVVPKTLPNSPMTDQLPDVDTISLSKEDKKPSTRKNQRYQSTDLYKPRPLISNSSRRNRVTNKNDSELSRGTKRSSDSMEFSENKKPR